MSKTIYNKCNFNITVETPSMPSGLVEVEPIKFVGDTLKPIEHQCSCCKEKEAEVKMQVNPLHPPLVSKEAQEKFRKDFFSIAKAVSEAISKAKKDNAEKEG